MWAGILAGLKGIFTAISALPQIMHFLDKWFGKTPEQKAKEEMQDNIDERRNDAQEVGEAVKKAESGDTSAIEDIINRR